jgi:hypothetical protein
MGYLVNDSFIIRRRFVIEQLEVQFMDSGQPYGLVFTNLSFYAIPVFCNLRAAANQTTPYDAFVHIHLTNTANYGVGQICATYSQNASGLGVIDNNQYYAMLVNFQSAPNRFGGINGPKDLQIFWDVLPAVGDGDLIVDLGYIIQPI